MPKLPSQLPPPSSAARTLKSVGGNKLGREALSSPSGTVEALHQLSTDQFDNQTSRLQSQLLFRLLRRVPYPVVRVMPFIKKDIKSWIQAWQRRYGRGEIPEADVSSAESSTQASQVTELESEPSPYLHYRCPEHPLACSRLQQGQVAKTAADPDVPKGHCSQCNFPGLLADGVELQGQRGRYRVGRFLGKRGLGRLYLGQDVNRRQPVVVREYLLPRQHYNPTDQRLIRDTFENVAGLKLADGREQDFRIMEPFDVMGDRRDPERCYLITNTMVDQLETLRTFLTQSGALPPVQVRALLNQGLQTLTSLHGQKYTLPAGQIQTGLIHGNIHLDSIVIQPDAASYYETPQLLIFLRDLALWESIFIPPPTPTHVPTVADDLTALGQVGLYALLGRWTDQYGRVLKPRSFHGWPQQDRPLEQYLRQLLGIEEPFFSSAAEARRALLQLPPAPEDHALTLRESDLEAETKRRRFLPKWLWLLLLAGLGLLITTLLMRRFGDRPAVSSTPPNLCCIANVPAIPPGTFRYTTAHPGTWYPLWHSRNLVTQNKTLEQVLESQQPDLNLQLDPVATSAIAIDRVEHDQADFAIAPHLTILPPDLTVEPIAYDGLAIVVAFSYVERQQGLPHHLQGQLSVDQLRQLYTGEIQNWRELGGPNLAVKLYIPDQVEFIQVFEQRVLQTQEAIQSFRRQWGLDNVATVAAVAAADSSDGPGFIQGSSGLPLTIPESDDINGAIRAPLDMLQSILQDFEATSKVGSIGFTSVSQIYNQCSVYPLAIAPDRHSSAIQPFYQANDTPISPATDLCDDKGNYGPNQSLFVSPSFSSGSSSNSANLPTYPLAYPLTVLYRRDNSRLPIGPTFVQMMTTEEGQGLLQKTGLIPLESASGS